MSSRQKNDEQNGEDNERDVLDEAIAALRDETAAGSKRASSNAAATRSAVLLAATTRRRRMVIARLVLPIAAVLAASTAWAAATGRLPGLFHVASDAPPAASPASASAAPSQVVATTTTAPVTSMSTPDPATVPAPPASSSASGSVSASSSALPVASGAPRPTAPTAALDPEEALYRTAHEAHFIGHDPARALAAWDAYLAAHPRGRFAPEARYNRALTLVRMGKTDDARAALRPFADGTYGGYRQKEAKQLLEATE